MLTENEIKTLAWKQDADQCYEKLIEALYRRVLKAGDQAVDGGAHGGMHTLPLAEIVGVCGHVYAFEPVPAIARWLRDKVAHFPQISVFEKALSNRGGLAIFNCLVEEPWLSSLAERFDGARKTERITVGLARLDDLANAPIRFVKLDLEGAEYTGLCGAAELLKKQRPIIAFENGRIASARHFQYTDEDFFNFFRSVDYTVVDLFGRSFGPEQFKLSWDDQTVPHYLVATPNGNVLEIVNCLSTEVRRVLSVCPTES